MIQEPYRFTFVVQDGSRPAVSQEAQSCQAQQRRAGEPTKMITIKHPRSALSAAMAAVLLPAVNAAQAPEQFFLDDGHTPVQTAVISNGETRYEIRSGYAITEGDIVLGKVLGDGENPVLSRGIGRNSKLDRWVDGIVYYELAGTLAAADVQKVRDAVAHWNQFSTLRFTERTAALQSTQPDYILFEPSSGCASWVGKIGGEQAIWVGETCTAGSVIHEIGHAVGLFHEHTRTDRDNFINVELTNVIAGKEFNFDVMDVGADDIGVYDYGSIMHYGPSFFSRNGQSTITVPDGVEIGQRLALSLNDLASVNLMYQTDLTLTHSSTSDATTTSITFTVNNIGDNGANTVSVVIPQSSGAGLKSFTGNGWSCSNATTAATCTLDRLAEGAEVQLVANMNLGSVDANNIDAYLVSKTHDLDPGNNGSLPADAGGNTLPDQDGDGVTDVLVPPTTGTDTTNVDPDNTSGVVTGTDANQSDLPDSSGNGVPDVVQPTGSTTTDVSSAADASSGSNGSSSPQLGAANAGQSSGGGGAGWPLMLLVLVGLRRVLRQG